MPTPVSHLAAPIPGLEFLDIGGGSLGELVASLYIWGVGIVGLAAFIGIVIGGVYYLTAGGSTSKTGEGKKWISNSLFGLGLALISYLLLNTINPALVNPNQARIPLITGELNTNTPPQPTTLVCPGANINNCRRVVIPPGEKCLEPAVSGVGLETTYCRFPDGTCKEASRSFCLRDDIKGVDVGICQSFCNQQNTNPAPLVEQWTCSKDQSSRYKSQVECRGTCVTFFNPGTCTKL